MTKPELDLVKTYTDLLDADDTLSYPLAAILALLTVVQHSPATTMSELLAELSNAATMLQAQAFNPVSLSAGADLLFRFITLQRPPVYAEFSAVKQHIVSTTKEFVKKAQKCIEKIALLSTDFVRDEMTILTHSYSRVVVQTLLLAHKQRKRFKVYVTESRPLGLGVKTHAVLSAAGIPCQLILDSAVAFTIGRIDKVLLGAEALAENGGLVNFVGSYQMALCAKAYNKPVYALAESYKFLRIFPLTQFDLPTSRPVFSFPTSPAGQAVPATPSRILTTSPPPNPLMMPQDHIDANPLLDYTTPDLLTGIISDVGVLTPSGVSDTLLGVFGGS